MTAFICRTCGASHEEMPRLLTVAAPAAWQALTETERRRGHLTDDQCIIDDRWFFLLGRLELPVDDGGEPFTWMTWVSVSEDNFLRSSELWQTPGREREPPYFAWIQSALPYPEPTLNLKADLMTQPVGQRPKIFLQETEHPLWREQKHGISTARVQEIVESILHRA